jgi:hypothetical protein
MRCPGCRGPRWTDADLSLSVCCVWIRRDLGNVFVNTLRRRSAALLSMVLSSASAVLVSRACALVLLVATCSVRV